MDWEKAINHIRVYKQEYARIGAVGIFGLMSISKLELRYENGERTKELYDEMMEVE